MKFKNGIDLDNQKGINAADGTANSDLVTVGQMKNLFNGKDMKDAAVVGVLTNVTVASPGASLNGVTLNPGDRVLLLAQTAGAENGLWVWAAAGTPMTRPADFVTGEVTQGATVVALGGTNPTREQWSLTTADPITVGTTSLTFTISGAPGATYTQGNGILISGGNVVSVDPAVVVRKVAATIGDGTSTSIDVAHNLGTLDIMVVTRDTGDTLNEVIVDNRPKSGTNPNIVTLTFPVAPTTGQYRVEVFG